MGKAMIIEAQDSNAIYEQGKHKGVLGKLKGIFADFKHGTRNADRLYSEELWDNRVFNNEDVMEALETKTLFGELDHPDGERCETKAQNAAITITKLEKKPEEGVIYGEAEILDTPTGKILKALADSGAQLGISSRGIGEEIYENGQNIIDPETYDFITFDVVVTPANKKARVSLSEGKKINKLNESFEKAIKESDTKNQLNQIKEAIDNTNNINKSSLLNLIEAKKLSLNNSNKNNKLLELNKKIAFDILKERFIQNQEELNESIKATNNLSEENNKLLEELEYYKSSKSTIKNKLRENLSQVYSLNKKIENLENQSLLNKEELIKKDKMIENINLKNNVKVQKESIYLRQINELKDKLKLESEKNEKLSDENEHLAKKLDECSKIILENKRTIEKIEKVNKDKLTESKKAEQIKLLQEKQIKELKERVQSLTEKVKQTENLENRFSKLAFNPIGTVKAVAENFKQGDLSQDDIDLYNALIGQ